MVYRVEDFLKDLEGVLVRLCDFIGAGVDSEMIARTVGQNENRCGTTWLYKYS